MPPSPKQYVCEKCQKLFFTKNDFERHSNRKEPCVAITDMSSAMTEFQTRIDIETHDELVKSFKRYLNILRDNEGITGDKALRNLSFLLILKLIEPHFGKDIDIDTYDYELADNEYLHRLLTYVRFSKLGECEDMNLLPTIRDLWENILSVHPATCQIFKHDRMFDIRQTKTFKTLIQSIHALDIENTSYDVLGAAYEEVIQDIMTGKVLGQFFTLPFTKRLMVSLIDPQIHDDGTIETCCDPTMGTGGFLITYIRAVLRNAKLRGIVPNWEQITHSGLYGREIDPDTYSLAQANMLISCGHSFPCLEHGDSIRQPITNKFDVVMANPPFGIKGLNYDDFAYALKSEYVPIKTRNAVSLFLQAIIYILKENGRAAVVVPDGQDLFSKDSAYVAVREYLMKTCELREIIHLPTKNNFTGKTLFASTSVKTCVFYFHKKIEGKNVLLNSESKDEEKGSKKTKQKIGKKYSFVDAHQTTSVKFYSYEQTAADGDGEKKLIVEVPVEKIAANSYNLNYNEYIIEENNVGGGNGIVVKTLGEVCDINCGERIVKKNNEDGEYLVYGSGRATFSTQTFNREGFNVYVGRFALSPSCVHLRNERLFLNDSGMSIKPKTDDLNHKYIGYYLYNNQHDVYNCGRGTAQKNIDMDMFRLIPIPIPPLELQHQIVEYLDFLHGANQTSLAKIAELKRLNEYCLTHQKMFGENEVKELGDVFKEVKTGKDVVVTDRKKGEYPFYGANGIIDYVDNYIFDGKYLLTARTGSLGSLHISTGKFWCSGDVHRIEFENDTLLSYAYHYLQTIDFQRFKTGSAHPKLSGSSLKSIKVHIPSLERQQEIVAYCEQNDNLIKQLEADIEMNKQLASQFLTTALKIPSSYSSVCDDEQTQTTDNIQDTSTSVVSTPKSATDEHTTVELESSQPKINPAVVAIKKRIVKRKQSTPTSPN